jgi:hypothetical protein
MRRTRFLLLAATAGVALLASACGVTADTTAATVEGRTVPIEDVTELVEDPAFAQGAQNPNESVQSGELARQALLFLIERAAWAAELERWGVQIDDAEREQLAAQLDEQIASSGEQVSERYRSLLVDFQAARTALAQRFSQIDPESDDDLRRLYDGSELQWRQVCLTVVQLPTEGIERARGLVDDQVEVTEVAERIDGAAVVADPSQGCFAEVGLVPELRAELERASVGSTRGVVLADDGAGGVNAYVFRLEARRNLSFDEAREDLAAAAASLAEQGPDQWVQLLTLDAQVNPRYGQGVVRAATGFEVQPPERPALPYADRIEQALALAEAAASAAPPVDTSGG